MADDIKIGIASDTRDFEKGVDRGVVKPLEDVEKALENVDKASDGTSESLESDMKNSQKATEKFQTEIKQVAKELDAAGRASKHANKGIQDDFDGTSNNAKANVQELGNEARQNLAETLSSFDGSVEGFVNGIQGTLGGVVSGLSGVGGILLATAGAAGLGLIVSQIQKGAEESQAWREDVANLADEFIETGGIAETSLDYIIDKLKELATETDDAEPSLSKLSDTAKKAGSSYKDLANAVAGNNKELDALLKKGEDRVDQLEREREAVDTTSRAENGRYAALSNSIAGQEKYNDYLRQAKEMADAAAVAEANYVRSGGPELERKAALIATVNDAYDEAAGSVTDFINKETGVFDVAAYVASMQAREQALIDYQNTLATSGLTPEAQAFLNEQGEVAASQFLAGYKSTDAATKAELNRLWTVAGKENSGVYGTTVKDALATAFGGVSIAGPTVKAKVDVDRSALDRVIGQTFSVIIQTVDSLGRKIR